MSAIRKVYQAVRCAFGRHEKKFTILSVSRYGKDTLTCRHCRTNLRKSP